METMSRRIETPFGSIENAQQYIRLLVAAVAEAKRDVDDDIIQATDRMLDRRVQALRLVEYNLEKLHRYLSASSHTLNDLRSLRRLLLEERPATNGTKPHQVAGTSPLTITTSASEPLRVGQDRAVSDP